MNRIDMADRDFTLTKDILHELFEYREGVLYSKKQRGKLVIGQKVGSAKRNGYEMVGINHKTYLTHRIIFMIHHGFLPKYIDHIDGNSLNNKIENLREATLSQNQYNSKIPKNNTSGVKGVNWDKDHSKWRARVIVNKKTMFVGLFKEIEEAAKAIKAFREKQHKDFARFE